MRSLSHVLYYPSRADTFTLYHLTDLHIGARACDEKLLKRDIAAIAADPNARWIGGGDYGEFIARKSDKRYREETLAPWLRGKPDIVGQQRDRILDLLTPIAGKCLGLGCGNHEDAVLSYYDRDIYHEIVRGVAQAAGTKEAELAFGVQGFITLTFRRGRAGKSGNAWRFVVYSHHGAGGGRLPGGHALALGRTLSDYDCDLALLGHRHVRQFVDKTVVGPGRRGFTKRYRAALFVASYLDAFVVPAHDAMPVDTYPEKMMLPAQSLGTTPIVIDPDEKTFDAIMTANASRAALRLAARPDHVIPFDQAA